MIRRALLVLIALAWLPLAGQSMAQSQDRQPGDMALGRADAPVTVVEYASVTCPHCARWHAEVFPEFKRRFIDTGRVRFIFRELPTPPAQIAAAGFLMARCAGPDRYFEVVGRLMREQSQILSAPRERLIAIAGDYGMNEAAFMSCVTDEQAIAAMNARVQHAIDRGVSGTPTFYVDGREVASGEAPLATLAAAIEAAE